MHNVSVEQICVVGFADLNVPNAQSKSRIADIAKGMAMLNDLNGDLNLAIVEFPDTPKASSKRGLADEEQEIQNSFWTLKQFCDVRYILPFELHAAGEQLTKRRQVQVCGSCIIALAY